MNRFLHNGALLALSDFASCLLCRCRLTGIGSVSCSHARTIVRFVLFPQFSMDPWRPRVPSNRINPIAHFPPLRGPLSNSFYPLSARKRKMHTCAFTNSLVLCKGEELDILFFSSLLRSCTFKCNTESDTLGWLRSLILWKFKIRWNLATAVRHYHSSFKALYFFHNGSCSCLMLWVHYWKVHNSFTVIFTFIQHLVIQLQEPCVWKHPYKTN